MSNKIGISCEKIVIEMFIGLKEAKMHFSVTKGMHQCAIEDWRVSVIFKWVYCQWIENNVFSSENTSFFC